MSHLLRRGLGKLLAAPGKMMQNAIRQDVQQSVESKITTDANGNASLNMNNRQVQASMRARMEELARKG
jgi:hypothetical protein